MKFKSAILGMALLALCAGAAHAQGTNWVGVNAGVGAPSGDYGNAAATGWNLGVNGTHMLNDQWGVGADLGYHAWNASKDLQAATEALYGPGAEFKWSAIQATGNTMFRFPTTGSVQPYAKVGVGMYSLHAKLSGSGSGNSDASENKLGYNFGAGVQVASSGNMKWGVNGAYHVIPAQKSFGSDVNEFSFGVNLMWGVGGR